MNIKSFDASETCISTGRNSPATATCSLLVSPPAPPQRPRVDVGGYSQPTRLVHPHPSSTEAIPGPLLQGQGGTYQGLTYSAEELSGEEGYSCWKTARGTDRGFQRAGNMEHGLKGQRALGRRVPSVLRTRPREKGYSRRRGIPIMWGVQSRDLFCPGLRVALQRPARVSL